MNATISGAKPVGRISAFGFGLAVMAALLVLLPPRPAHAATFTVNSTGDAPDANLANAACDANASVAGNQCTLRAAIQEANDTAGADVIRFNIISNASVKTISPASPLPDINEAVTINGYSQPGASANTLAEGNDAVLKIQLNGADAGAGARGLVIAGNTAGGTTIKGLVINRFSSDGVIISGTGVKGSSIQGNFIGTNAAGTADLGNLQGVNLFNTTDNFVGGLTAAGSNIISGNTVRGVIMASGSTDNFVQGNFIGTNAAGTADLGNGDSGVEVFGGSGNLIGGTVSGARNVISGNDTDGVEISSGSHRVEGNFIGTNAAGTVDLGNSIGVFIRSSNNAIGGTATGSRNIISGNSQGVRIEGGGATGNKVEGNRIGTKADGTGDLGNGFGVLITGGTPNNTIGGTSSGAGNTISGNDQSGVRIESDGTTGNKVQGNAIRANADDGVNISILADGNLIGGGNVIFSNGDSGVEVQSSGQGNLIASNQIFANAGLGIDLLGGTEDGFGVTANDTDDPDTGANDLQNFPVITSATRSNTTGATTITGTLNSTPSTRAFTIQFFVALDGEPSNHGEGQILLGSKNVATDANGDASFSFVTTGLVAGQEVSATATNKGSGDTSEFSLNRTVVPGP